MNCEDFESNVSDLARDQKMDAGVRTQALAHGEECEVCSRRLEKESALSFRLRVLASDTNAVTIPPMRSELLAALRSHRVRVPSSIGVDWRRRKMISGAMAVAALVLIVVAATLIRLRSTTSTVVNQSNSSSLQRFPGVNNEMVKAPVTTDRLPVLAPKTNPSFPGRKNIRHKVNRLPVPSQAGIEKEDVAAAKGAPEIDVNSAQEITSDFITVGYASASTLQDGGQLVRVELPRSALVAFGLPMNMNRSDEKVKADVFFGTDGMARAIRFVQ